MQINTKKLSDELKAIVPHMEFGDGNPNNRIQFARIGSSSVACIKNVNGIFLKMLSFSFPEFSISTSTLMSTLEVLKDSDVDLSVESNTKLVLTSDSTHIEIPLITNMTSILLGVGFPEKTAWKEISASFITAIEKVYKSSVDDKKAYSSIINYTYIDGVNMVATNGVELSRYMLEEPYDKMFLSRYICESIITSKPSHYYVNEASVMFKYNNEFLFVFRTLSNKERYPIVVNRGEWSLEELEANKEYCIEVLANSEGVEFKLDNRVELVKVLKTAYQFAKNNTTSSYAVRVVSDGSSVEVSTSGSTGYFRKSVQASCSECDFTIHVVSFIKALESKEDIYIKDDKMKVIGDNFAKIILLNS